LKNHKRSYLHIIILFLLILSLISYYYIEVNIKPTLKSICEVKARVIATQIINDTVREELQKIALKKQILIPTYDIDGKLI